MKTPKPRKLKSGTYFIQLRLNGVSVPVSASNAKECTRQAELIKAEYRAEKRTITKSDKTLRQAADEYINKSKDRWSSPTTAPSYYKIMRNNFPTLWDLKLAKITDDILQDAIDKECARLNKHGQKYSPKSIKNAYSFVAEVLKRNKIIYNTPKLPEVKRKPVQILLPEQVYEAVKGTEIELPCLLAMWMTFTISEIRGFTKSKSIRNGQISVVETVVDVDGKPVRKPCAKEEERGRTQDIPPYIQSLIDKVDGDIICPLSSQATNKRLQRRLTKFGYPPISFHKLRHISASSATALNIPPIYIKERGGWKTDEIMNRVYTHTFSTERKNADERINDYFDKIIANEIANKNSESA